MLLNTLFLALRSIRRNLLRSFLTILGIVIGVSAVITMVTLGNGATQAVQTQIASLGSNLLMVRVGQRQGPGGAAGAPQFKEADAAAIQSQIGGVAAAAPEGRAAVTVVGNGRNWATNVTGSSNAWFVTGNWKLASGRLFEDDEQRAGAAVCIIGETVRREIFGGALGLGGLGESLRIKQFSCTVIGVLASKGQAAMGNDQDDTVLVPLRTLQRRVTGSLKVGTLLISMEDGSDIGIVIATAASYVLAGVMGVPYLFDPAINLLSFVFSAGIGMLFGYFPARRAAQMDPIEALRHE